MDADMESRPEPGFGVLASPRLVRSLWQPPTGDSPWCAGSKASEYWIVCRVPVMSRQSYLPLPLVRAFGHRIESRSSRTYLSAIEGDGHGNQ